MAEVYDLAGAQGTPESGVSLGSGSGEALRKRVFGVVGALMQRRRLTLPVGVDQSLRDAGLKSLDLVNMMLAVDDEFVIEIPQELLTIDNFQTIGAIERLVATIAPL